MSDLEDKYTAWLYENYSIGNGDMLIRLLEDMTVFDKFLSDNDLPPDTELA